MEINEMTDVTFKLDGFEGPLDLLMHLISKNKVAIDDIPIALILDQYLSYLEAMRSLNIEVTSDFIVMAAQLILIKSRMLLPRAEKTPEEDPRRELVRRLEEYRLIKLASAWLAERGRRIGEVHVKDAEPLPGKPEYTRRHSEEELLAALLRMVSAQKEIAAEPLPQVFAELVGRESESIEDASERIMSLVRSQGRKSIMDILVEAGSRHAAIATFLALLELCRDNLIWIDDEDFATVREDENELKTESLS